jgi:membrane-bound metal-dependent hydrolase YbcI (DUF457 family)
MPFPLWYRLLNKSKRTKESGSVDPLTHALTSLAAARAVQKWLPPFGVSIVVAAGLAPDLDFASYGGGAERFLEFHRGALHGFAGASLTACIIAALACAFTRNRALHQNIPRLNFLPALSASLLGICTHLTLDFLSGLGVMFLWPWSLRWRGCEVVKNFDPGLLFLLLAGILLPGLFRLVSEEIGEPRRVPRGRIASIATLVMAAAYLGFRAELRERALHLLMSSEYHGRAPEAAGAFPRSGNPFDWRGVVSTESTFEEVFVSLAGEGQFDPDRSTTLYKPEDSPVLEAAENVPVAKRFVAYARFPLASVENREGSFTVKFRDLRFSFTDSSPENVVAIVNLGSRLEVLNESFRFAFVHER